MRILVLIATFALPTLAHAATVHQGFETYDDSEGPSVSGEGDNPQESACNILRHVDLDYHKLPEVIPGSGRVKNTDTAANQPCSGSDIP